MPLGTTTEMDGQLNYYNQMYEGVVYGIPYTAGVTAASYTTRQYSKQQESQRYLRLPQISSQH